MERLKLTESGKKYLTAAVVSAAVYFFMKYLSPILSPFVLAFLLAWAFNPLAERLHKKTGIKKSVFAAFMVVLICGLLLALLWMICTSLITESGRLAAQIPYYQKELCVLLGNCCDFMEERFGVNSVQIENFVLEQVNIMAENMEINVLPAVMGKSMDCMRGVAHFVSFVVVMLIAVLLIIKDYDRYLLKLKEEEELRGVWEVAGKVVDYVKTFIRTQLILLGIISGICAVTLFLIGMKGGIFYGLLTGFMDMLPFIGTGIMLIPLAVYMLINGSGWKALVCLLLYGSCVLIREFLEPKLIGERIGVLPVGILFAVFAGLHLFGVWGIIKGPLSLVIICETCKYLWKAKEA